MKKFRGILVLSLISIILNTCAKPTVVSVVMPEDENLNCEQLNDAFAETRRFKQEAEAIRDPNSGGNVTRGVLFWPALLKTLQNADEAIKAANDRGYHLINIMKNKNCKKVNIFFAELTRTSAVISDEIKRLDALYQSGVLTEEEFKQAKKKVLSQ